MRLRGIDSRERQIESDGGQEGGVGYSVSVLLARNTYLAEHLPRMC
jgi:hypothetical protein